jgi:hypothetical protein
MIGRISIHNECRFLHAADMLLDCVHCISITERISPMEQYVSIDPLCLSTTPHQPALPLALLTLITAALTVTIQLCPHSRPQLISHHLIILSRISRQGDDSKTTRASGSEASRNEPRVVIPSSVISFPPVHAVCGTRRDMMTALIKTSEERIRYQCNESSLKVMYRTTCKQHFESGQSEISRSPPKSAVSSLSALFIVGVMMVRM